MTSMLSFVERHGWLRAIGNKIVDQYGNPVVLRGVSLFWSQWMPQYYNAAVVKWLCQDWKINVIRAAMAIHEGGYLEYPEREMAKVHDIIRAAVECGIYVIVDWHAHLPERDAAAAFFLDLSLRYPDCPNLIFEPWNEPGSSFDWISDIRPYHQAVIDSIRPRDPRRLLIAGTENFSQGVDKAARNPVRDDNTAYTLHFYAASHRGKLRQRALDAWKSGIALIVTEYGTCEASGDGRFDPVETSLWWRFLEDFQIGYINWSVADKVETAAILNQGAGPKGSWGAAELTRSGQLVREQLIAKADMADIAMSGSARYVSGGGAR